MDDEEEGGGPRPGTSREKLDIASDGFDPLEALYNPDFVIPRPDAPLMDNVESFVSLYERGGVRTHQKKPPKGDEPPKEALCRQFTEEQLPVASSRKKKTPANVLTFMGKQLAKGGPMSELAKCLESGRRVKVYVRGIDRMRGHCSGFLAAFDKHWNLAMTDVEEVYTRRRYRKPALIDDDVAAAAAVGDDGSEEVGFSRIRVVKTRKKAEVCKRHVPQVVLRGEHVASVVLL